MDVVDRIESTRFLGLEFLLWLWFSRDITEGALPLEDIGIVDVTLESQLSLMDPLTSTERVVIRGADPCSSPEADQALRSGKLPNVAVLRIIKGESEWLATLNAETLGLSGVKLPALLTEADDERFLERMSLLEELTDFLDGLYAKFIHTRLSDSWQEEVVPAQSLWVKGSMDWTAEQHEKLHAAASKRGGSRKSGSKMAAAAE